MASPRTEPQTAPDPLSLARGRRVASLRSSYELAAHELASRAGMDANYLWRIEAGRQNLSFRNVARLAKAFELTLSEFLEGVELPDVELGSRPYVRRSASKSPGGEEPR